MIGKKRNKPAKSLNTLSEPSSSDERVTREELPNQLAKAGTLEADLTFEINKSRRLAWSVAKVATFAMFVALGITGFVIYRYSQPIAAQLLVLNPETGVAEPTQLVTSQQTYGEAVDSGNIARFIINHESYNYYQQQSLFDTTMLMSSRTVAGPYASQFGGQNGIDKQWGDTRVVRVDINSIITNTETGQATVRYTTQVHDRGQMAPEPKQHWIATLSYSYPNRTMTVEDRYINPLGFLVTSFDKHRETTGR